MLAQVFASNYFFLSLSVAVIAGIYVHMHLAYPQKRFAKFFLSIVLGMNTLFYCVAFWSLPEHTIIIDLFRLVALYCNMALLVQFALSVLHGKLRPTLFRIFITYPAFWFSGCCLVGFLTSIVLNRVVLAPVYIWLIPALRTEYYWQVLNCACALFSLAAASMGLYQSLEHATGEEIVEIDLRSEVLITNKKSTPYTGLERVPCRTYKLPASQHGELYNTSGQRNFLTIFQMTDVHLGPCMSVQRLKQICENAVKLQPDLILLTGDLDTMECRNSPEALKEGLAPLKAYQGKVFSA